MGCLANRAEIAPSKKEVLDLELLQVGSGEGIQFGDEILVDGDWAFIRYAVDLSGRSNARDERTRSLLGSELGKGA